MIRLLPSMNTFHTQQQLLTQVRSGRVYSDQTSDKIETKKLMFLESLSREIIILNSQGPPICEALSNASSSSSSSVLVTGLRDFQVHDEPTFQPL
ncbi:Hypothetical protein NTJ_05061 [Nesidiocoris tenuis]|uniref:Uncharacterized protein n=1 Tax=Nesidiocoris tenuis TaxID=355587 RepID=A0ABN7ALR5_9HEMI|nr:Hypothetical protein NTJ_05061 [Nesidiocoris tenuis]